MWKFLPKLHRFPPKWNTSGQIQFLALRRHPASTSLLRPSILVHPQVVRRRLFAIVMALVASWQGFALIDVDDCAGGRFHQIRRAAIIER